MRITFLRESEPKSSRPKKVDEDSRLLLYQDRIANRNRSLKAKDYVFVPRMRFAK